jgi:hypothetical protein
VVDLPHWECRIGLQLSKKVNTPDHSTASIILSLHSLTHSLTHSPILPLPLHLRLIYSATSKHCHLVHHLD